MGHETGAESLVQKLKMPRVETERNFRELRNEHPKQKVSDPSILVWNQDRFFLWRTTDPRRLRDIRDQRSETAPQSFEPQSFDVFVQMSHRLVSPSSLPSGSTRSTPRKDAAKSCLFFPGALGRALTYLNWGITPRNTPQGLICRPVGASLPVSVWILDAFCCDLRKGMGRAVFSGRIHVFSGRGSGRLVS